jgi:hypothetical protein
MSWMNSILAEIWGLFVDDARFALSIASWLVAAWLVLPHLEVAASLKGPILFAGLGILLVGSVLRRARS